MIRQYELVERVREYNPDTDEALLNRAYVFGARAHAHQKRASGEPYFGHPLEVAAILTDLRLDDATIVTALLHDTVEDTAATSEELVRLFGSEIASLVDGVTKLNKLELSSKEAAQAENFRKLLLAMARDVRVLLVKLADRLHNMKTIGHLRLEKRQRIARETMEIYAPLAGRMGMQSIREQLEDLAFEVLNPEARTSIMRRFIKLRNERGDLIPYISADIFAAIAAAGITAEVRGREKRPYSVWRKMEEKETSFSRLSDIYGFRIMCETEDECYRILGIVHRKWRMVPERFKDYISSPKSNGYRSIHTAVVSDEGQRIEIQIRTHEMHAVAETGVAAHWAFKDGIQAENRFAVDPFRWLHDLADQVARGERDGEDEDGEHPEEFLERVKLDMFTDQVFCFTPKGDVIGLPRGATPVDFAYAIHTKVGNHCAGAMIDGRRAPLWTRLRNGQQVEIITAEGQAPSPHWEAMAQTGRAKSAIRRALRTRVLREQIALGRELLSDSFERAGRQPADKTFAVAAERLGQRSTDTMLAALARGELTSAQIIGAVYPTQMSEMRPDADAAQGPVRRVRGLRRGLALSFCTGCWPIPGDRIVGLTRTGRVEVHAISCPYLEKFEDEMERWQNLSWDVEASALPNNLARINLILANEPGTLGRVCSLVGEQLANIDNLSMSERRPDFVSMQMDLEVRDVRHLSDILTALRAQTFVHSVERATGRDERQDATVDDGQARLPLPPGGRTVA